jgi:hypothetical protein
MVGLKFIKVDSDKIRMMDAVRIRALLILSQHLLFNPLVGTLANTATLAVELVSIKGFL